MKTIKYKPILDIFSKRKESIKNFEKPKIIIDYREKNSLVASELSHLGAEIEFKELKVGDYIIKNITKKFINLEGNFTINSSACWSMLIANLFKAFLM